MTTFIHKNLTGADAVHPAAFVQATDPGTVGANLWWVDTSSPPPYLLKLRNATNTGWNAFGATGATGTPGATGPQGPTGSTGPIGTPGTTTVTGAAPYVCVKEQKTAPSDGGTFTGGSWQTRVLNTIVANDLTTTLASNQLTLPAGTYRCMISCPAYEVSTHVAQLLNATDNASLLRGTVEFSGTTAGISVSRSIIAGRFFLRSPKPVSVQHWATATKTTLGFGVGSSSGGALDGGADIYTVAEFWLEGPPPPFMGSTDFSANPRLQAARGRQDHLQHSINTPPQ